jgi:flavorubredoxin
MQKKILLSAVNAKFIHSNLAVRYLKKYCENKIEGIDIAEFSINDNFSSILKKL